MKFLPLLCFAITAFGSAASSSLAAPSQPRRVPKFAPRRTPAPPIGDFRRQKLQAHLRALTARRESLLREFPPRSPEVRAIEREIAHLREMLRSLPPSHPLPPVVRPMPSTTRPYLQLLQG